MIFLNNGISAVCFAPEVRKKAKIRDWMDEAFLNGAMIKHVEAEYMGNGGGRDMIALESYAEKARRLGVSRAEIIDTRNVVVENWVRVKCQYGCGVYGECLTCPPYSPPPDYTKKMIGEYSKGLLMQIENNPPTNRPRLSSELRRIVAELEREIFVDGYYKAFGLAAGPCRLCKTCDTKDHCKYPYMARPSMEACGIDVYRTARNCGFELEVVKREDSPYAYVGLILIE